MNFKKIFLFTLVCFSLFLNAYSKQDVQQTNKSELEKISRSFSEALIERDYAKAYAMTSKAYQSKNSLTKMKTDFEQILPLDSGHLSINEGIIIESPDPENKNELGSAYVTIDLDEDFEAIFLIFVSENNQTIIDTIEFGRAD